MCAVELIDVQMIGQVIYFFFQAEDGIRDPLVTGVQTCALPIFVEQKEAHKADASLKKGLKCFGNAGAYGPLVELNEQNEGADEIGRASCRGKRVDLGGRGIMRKKKRRCRHERSEDRDQKDEHGQ